MLTGMNQMISMEKLAKMSNVALVSALKKVGYNIPSEIPRFQLLETIRQLFRAGKIKNSDFVSEEETEEGFAKTNR